MSLFQSCWVPCAPAVNGFIIDEQSNLPLDSVKIELFEDNELINVVYSDSIGQFFTSLNSRSNFMFNKCDPTFSLVITKTGFISQNYSGNAPQIDLEIKLAQ